MKTQLIGGTQRVMLLDAEVINKMKDDGVYIMRIVTKGEESSFDGKFMLFQFFYKAENISENFIYSAFEEEATRMDKITLLWEYHKLKDRRDVYSMEIIEVS